MALLRPRIDSLSDSERVNEEPGVRLQGHIDEIKLGLGFRNAKRLGELGHELEIDTGGFWRERRQWLPLAGSAAALGAIAQSGVCFAFGLYPFKKDRGGLVGAAFLTSEFGFGGYEFTAEGFG